MRSMAVRPEDLLQVAGLGRRQLVVEDDGVGVDRQRQLPQLLGLALADVGGRIGRVAPLHDPGRLVGAGGVDQQGQLVEVLLRSRPRGRGGTVTPTSTIFSRKLRSIRLIGSPRSEPASRGSTRQSPRAALGPARTTVPSARSSTSRVAAGLVDRDPAPDPAPVVRRRTAAAQAPVPQAWVSPTPRSHTRMVISSGPGPRATNSTFRPPGIAGLERRPELAHVDARRGRDRGPPGGGCRCRRELAVAHVAALTVAAVAATDLGLAHLDARPGPGRTSPGRSDGHGPQAGRGRAPRTAGPPSTSPASRAAWARQRMPLPLISASLPSALRSSKRERAPRPAAAAG